MERSNKSLYASENAALTNAIHRCHNKRCAAYKNYGARGIKVCAEWQGPNGFDRFLRHIGPKPDPTYTLDRINNDGDYKPGNVRWADRTTQIANRRPFNRRPTDYGWGIGTAQASVARGPRLSGNLLFEGRIQTLFDWCVERSLNGATVRQRLDRGETVEQALRQGGRDYALEKVIRDDARARASDLVCVVDDAIKKLDAAIAQLTQRD